jgi:hypothetical protein
LNLSAVFPSLLSTNVARVTSDFDLGEKTTRGPILQNSPPFGENILKVIASTPGTYACNDFKNIFAVKKAERLSFFTFNTAKSCKNWIVTLFFLRKTPKTEKSPKLAEISDHSIYPWSGLTHTPFIVLRGKMLHFQRSANLCILKRGIYVDNK